ncbi:hypothetical protein K0G86_26285 [Bacteroides thetaiotaomicron]|nr:hypothetical protein [Bacteroides thetaiotaomicron]MCE9152775.1 hypothetical protein [Bacteroides thetaiotaomicron]
MGVQIPEGAWNMINVIESSVIFEAKDGHIMNLGMQ